MSTIENARRPHKHVLINGNVFLYQDKAPFVAAGKSVLGAIEYNQDEDSLKCHICGDEETMLGRHVSVRHKMPSSDYKRKFGLNQSSALVGERIRMRLSDAAQKRVKAHKLPPMWYNPELKAKAIVKGIKNRRALLHINKQEEANSKKHCKAQLLQKLKDIAVILKRTPSRRELKEYGVPSGSLEFHYGSLAKAMQLANLAPNNYGSGDKKLYSNEQLLRAIRIFEANNGRRPVQSDFQRGMLIASSRTYRNRFGSLKKAYIAATAPKKTVQPERAKSVKAGAA